MNRYALPDLSYDYDALEPHISAKIMQLHHDKHHRAYVDGANKAIEKLLDARDRGDFSNLASIERLLAFNVGGHILHSIFWQNLSPHGGGEPSGDLKQTIEEDFGSFDTMKKQLIELASTTNGSGWAALIWDPLMKRLGTAQIHDHQSELNAGAAPLLVIDAWEHAYYLQYQTDKAGYFAALFEVFHWEDVAHRFAHARSTDLAIDHAASAASAHTAG